MVFSKSFGYAIRSVLYLAAIKEQKARVSLDEIADTLHVPRHFLGKVMKKLAKQGVLASQKGPTGGFSTNDQTMTISLLELVQMAGDTLQIESCVLRLKKCNGSNPCPMHEKVESLRKEWISLLARTKIGDLYKEDQPELLRSIIIT